MQGRALLLKNKLDEEISLAREIQMSTLPTEMPQIAGYDLHGEFRPAEQAGGDTFDLVEVDGKLFTLLADATGHGFGPAILAHIKIIVEASLSQKLLVGATLNNLMIIDHQHQVGFANGA